MQLVDGILFIITCIVVFYSFYFTVKIKKLNDENEQLRLNLKSISILSNFKIYDFIHSHVNILFSKTKVDRFLILYAVNGKNPFKYATAFFEVTRYRNTNTGAIYKYVDIEVDSYYQELLKTAINTNEFVVLDVNNMPDSLLKRIYTSSEEQVNHSLIKYLHRVHIDKEQGIDLLIYCSTATMDENKFTDTEMKIINNELKLIRASVQKMKFN